MAADLLLTAIRAHLDLPPTHRVSLEPLKKGASSRTIVRLKPEGLATYIGIHHTLERADNENFLPVAQHLKKVGLNVPEVIYNNPAKQIAIVEDLGDIDLQSMVEKPFDERLPYYRKAFEQLDKLFYSRKPKDFDLQPPFTPQLYRWEQDYFTEHFIEGYWGRPAAPLRASKELYELAEGLGASSRHLVHRDFQSQNLIIRDDEVYMIDFQGLRLGRQEYDLASILYDPYLDHSDDEREQLLDIWEDVTEERPNESILRDCAIQRLMQAIGAYANIILNKGDDSYKAYLPVACRQLKAITTGTPYASVLHPHLDLPEA